MNDLFVGAMLIIMSISFLALWVVIADAKDRVINPCRRRANFSGEGVLVVMALAFASFLITAAFLL